MNIPTARDRNINKQLGYSDILFCSLRDGSCDVIALPSVQGRVFSSSPGRVLIILAVNSVSCWEFVYKMHLGLKCSLRDDEVYVTLFSEIFRKLGYSFKIVMVCMLLTHRHGFNKNPPTYPSENVKYAKMKHVSKNYIIMQIYENRLKPKFSWMVQIDSFLKEQLILTQKQESFSKKYL